VYERRVAPWVIGFLLLLGAVAFGLRTYAQRQSAMIEYGGVWRLSYDVKLEADEAGVRIQMAVPRDTAAARVVRQNVNNAELRNERLRTSSTQTRLSLLAPQPGHYDVSARFDLDLRPRTAGATEMEPPPNTREIDRWLRPTSMLQSKSEIVVTTLGSLHDTRVSPVGLLEKIFEFCSKEIENVDKSAVAHDAETVLRQRSGTSLGKAHAMLALCRAAQIPSRLVTGFELREEPSPEPAYWIEAYVDSRWEAYDPVRQYSKEMPVDFVPVCRGSDQVVVVSENGTAEVEYSVHRIGEGGFASTLGQHPADIFDLNRLPLSMHDTLAVILLLPLGALVTAVFQTIVGVRTIGTFSPTLIALSFVLADWRTGVAVFALVVMVGLMSRALLDRLKLLMVPRLGFMLTLVVAILVFTISILDYLRFTPSHQAVLLPLVILTMTVERFYVASAEDGVSAAIKLMLGTILVSFCCYLTLGWHHVGTLVFRFPEVHLITLAAFIYLGRYTGYRLTELWRFRDLLSPNETDRS
jgi:7 transmembrane helices usually fused to an inactive transglutaminase/Transglutaminase-like superfamily